MVLHNQAGSNDVQTIPFYLFILDLSFHRKQNFLYKNYTPRQGVQLKQSLYTVTLLASEKWIDPIVFY